MGWKLPPPLEEGELGPHLTQCGQGRGLPACQVSSWSIQPFGHNTPTSVTDRSDRQSCSVVRLSRNSVGTPFSCAIVGFIYACIYQQWFADGNNCWIYLRQLHNYVVGNCSRTRSTDQSIKFIFGRSACLSHRRDCRRFMAIRLNLYTQLYFTTHVVAKKHTY